MMHERWYVVFIKTDSYVMQCIDACGHKERVSRVRLVFLCDIVVKNKHGR